MIGLTPLPYFDLERFLEDFTDADVLASSEMGRNTALPCILGVACTLFLGRRLGEVGVVQPPRLPGKVSITRLGPEPVTRRGKAVDIDLAAHDRPEAPAAGFVAKIRANIH